MGGVPSASRKRRKPRTFSRYQEPVLSEQPAERLARRKSSASCARGVSRLSISCHLGTLSLSAIMPNLLGTRELPLRQPADRLNRTSPLHREYTFQVPELNYGSLFPPFPEALCDREGCRKPETRPLGRVPLRCSGVRASLCSLALDFF